MIPVKPEKIKMEGTPQFKAFLFMDGDTRRAYLEPETLLIEDCPAPRKCGNFLSAEDTLKFWELLDRGDRLVLMPAELVGKERRSGMGAVYKDENWCRLIQIRCPQNSQERTLSRWTKLLAMGQSLIDLHIPRGWNMLIYASDIKNYFYQFVVSRSRAESNSMQG